MSNIFPSNIILFRYHIHFYDVTTVASRVRCESLNGGKKPAECLRILQPGGVRKCDNYVCLYLCIFMLAVSIYSQCQWFCFLYFDCTLIHSFDFTFVALALEPEPEGMRNNMDMMILDGSFLGGKGFYSIVSLCMLHDIMTRARAQIKCSPFPSGFDVLQATFERDEDNPAFNVYS